MPIQSKYSDQQIEQILLELSQVLEKHQSSTDLSLMMMGNMVTNILNNDVPRGQRKVIADKFTQALFASVDE